MSILTEGPRAVNPAVGLFIRLIDARDRGDVRAAMDLMRQFLACGWSISATTPTPANGGGGRP